MHGELKEQKAAELRCATLPQPGPGPLGPEHARPASAPETAEAGGLSGRCLAALGILGAGLSLLLAACTSTPGPAARTPGPQRPPDLQMNRDAGRLQPLYVMLRLQSGEELPFLVDTGCQVTLLDQSLEPKLGPRLGTAPLWTFDGRHEAGVYAAPKLYLGGVLLQKTGTNVVTLKCQPTTAILGRPTLGVLGIDVLEHYCLQLDFAARKLRFLDAENQNQKDWGQPFPLTAIAGGGYYISDNLCGGGATGSVVDTGLLGDGWLMASLFEQWTNQALACPTGQVRAPNGRLGGELYPELALGRAEPAQPGEPQFNALGIKFLARHLVTLDFPHHTMYLQRTSVGPLRMSRVELNATANSAAAVLRRYRRQGRLPGWAKGEQELPGSVRFEARSLLWLTLIAQKRSEASVYYFEVVRPAEDRPWTLQLVWHSDATGRKLQDYPVTAAP